MKHITSVVAGLLMAFVGTSESFAETITVCPTGCDYTSIQDAIDASSDGDVIDIDAGTYNEHNINTNGKAITIGGTLNADGSQATTIDAQQNGEVFRIMSGETASTKIQNLIITNGKNACGGAFDIHSSSPTIDSCEITNNNAQQSGNCGYGGAIYCQGTDSEGLGPTVTNCYIHDNQASWSGGAIYLTQSSSITVNHTTISRNSANNDNGGGIACVDGSSASLSYCSIVVNSANDKGGGCYVDSGTFQLDDSTVCGNTPDQFEGNHTGSGNSIEEYCSNISVPADYDNIQDAIDNSAAGAIIQIASGTYNEYSLNTNGKAITIQGTLNSDGSPATTIDAQQQGYVFMFESGETDQTVIKNLIIFGGHVGAGAGGGINCINHSSPTITNCHIVGNYSGGAGGGIYCYHSASAITGCTISNNTANQGGGIAIGEGTCTISNCTISANTTYPTSQYAAQGGGVFVCCASSVTINGCTISNNLAVSNPTSPVAYGGGVACFGGGPYQASSIYHSGCHFSGNSPDTVYGDSSWNPFMGGDEAGQIIITIEDCTLCGTGEHVSGLILHRGENHIYHCSDCAGDMNGDGEVNGADLGALLAAWGPCP